MTNKNRQLLITKFTNKLAALKTEGLFNTIRILEEPNQSWTKIKKRKILNFNSNNFLGFATDSAVIKASQAAIAQYGVGPGAVRSISGSLQIHDDFEKALATFKGAEACLVVQSGFVANTALIPTLLGPEDCIISDQLNHASIIDGIKLAKTNKMIFQHADMSDLEAKVQKAQSLYSGMIVIATDGVFSMDGEIAKLPEIVDIAQKYGAFTYVDDAWGECALGAKGKGTVEHFQLEGQIDFEVGTLSKGFGIQGGFITGPLPLINFLRQRSRPFIFSTGLGIAQCGAGLAVLKELTNSTERIKKLHHNRKYFKEGLQTLGFEIQSQTQIIPLMIYDEAKAQEMSQKLFEAGIFVTPIVFPTVPKGTARCRFIVSAAHSIADLDLCLAQIAQCARELAII